jgi:pSer/pThr/pTyr-binding forkhead associated (FHA) protein
MSDYIDVKINIFEHTDQRARVLGSLTPAVLINEILKEFDDILADAPEKYAIYLKGMERPLDSDCTIIQLDIQPHDTLVFDYVRQTIRQMLALKDYALLREGTTGKVFDIQWQPAIIGRPDSDAGHNLILAVNCLLLPLGRTVSRKHAQITFSDGRYFVEPLAENNPVFLNGKEIPLNSRREIKNNDKLAIGRNKITFVFEKQSIVDSVAAPPKPQAVKNTPPILTPTPVGGEDVAPPEENATFVSSGEKPLSYLVKEKCSAPENVGQKLAISDYPFQLGRLLPMFSDEQGISRKHAEITYDAHTKKFYITDLKSTNGVTIDGVLIQPEESTEIKPGSKLGLGMDLVLEFVV